VETLQQRIDDTHLPLRTMGQVFVTFGAAALFLSLLGVYGVTTQSVAGRTRELAIRLSLGGQKTDLLRLILQAAFYQVATGILLGALLSLWSSRFLASLLLEVRPWDSRVSLAVACLLIFAGLLACLIPAAKVLRASPGEVLRGE
ncbi:MAG: FtsX-like permease family protein, partial [bacterium]